MRCTSDIARPTYSAGSSKRKLYTVLKGHSLHTSSPAAPHDMSPAEIASLRVLLMRASSHQCDLHIRDGGTGEHAPVDPFLQMREN